MSSKIIKLTPDLIKKMIKEEHEKLINEKLDNKINESKKRYIVFKILNEIRNEENKLNTIKKKLIKKIK